MSSVRRHDLVCVAVLVLLWLAVWVPRLHGPIDLRWDASTYYVLGTSLAEGKGYRLLNEPGEIEAVQYPPLVPLIVAGYQRGLGTSDYLEVGTRLRLLYCVLSLLYLLAAYVLARTLLDPAHALLVGTLTGLSFYGFLYLSDSLYAEIPFGLVSILFLLCHRQGERPGYTVATGILGGIAYLLRTAGLALLVAWVAESVLRGRFGQAALRAAFAAVPVLLWQNHIHQVTAGEAYRQPTYSYQRAPYYYTNVSYGENSWLVNPFRPELGNTTSRDLAGRVARNLTAIPQALGESSWVAAKSELYLLDKLERAAGLQFPERLRAFSSGTIRVCLLVVGLLAILGAILVISTRERFLPLYFALSVGMIVLTPWPSQFWRYLAPLAPLTLVFLVCALTWLGAKLAGRGTSRGRIVGSMVATVPLAVMLLVQVFIASSFLRAGMFPVSHYDAQGNEKSFRLLAYEPQWHALDPALEWVRQHAGPRDVVATTVPHLAYLRTGRKAVLPPLEPDPAVAARLLDQVPASYLVLDELGLPGISEQYAAPVVAGPSSGWRLVYTTPGGKARVYERVR
jgi:hypothetical protein